MWRIMLSYLAGVAAYMEAGGPAASQRPVNQQSERQASARAHSSPSSQPEPSVVISFSSEALQAAKELSMADNMVEVAVGATHERDEGEQPDGGLRSETELNAEELRELRDLERKDLQVRTRDMAFIAAAGGAAGSYSVHYETGPDGQRYAVEADIRLDTSEGATPEQTLAKARALRAASMSGRRESVKDGNAAAKAMRMEAEARAELERQRNTEPRVAAPEPGLPEVDLPELSFGVEETEEG
jgi:hypothetical protein